MVVLCAYWRSFIYVQVNEMNLTSHSMLLSINFLFDFLLSKSLSFSIFV